MVGAIVGSAALALIVVGLAVFFLLKRRRAGKPPAEKPAAAEMPSAPAPSAPAAPDYGKIQLPPDYGNFPSDTEPAVPNDTLPTMPLPIGPHNGGYADSSVLLAGAAAAKGIVVKDTGVGTDYSKFNSVTPPPPTQYAHFPDEPEPEA